MTRSEAAEEERKEVGFELPFFFILLLFFPLTPSVTLLYIQRC
jgi:hypothetical protein